jgi:hypothetical protein
MEYGPPQRTISHCNHCLSNCSIYHIIHNFRQVGNNLNLENTRLGKMEDNDA